MFTKPTLFIVGAGGSKDIGFPVGWELKTEIAKKLNFHQTGPDLDSGDGDIARSAAIRFEPMNHQQLLLKGRTIAAAMPQAISIDNYLSAHSEDEVAVYLGKAAIAACIMEAEERSSIYVDLNSPHSIDFSKQPATWHLTFCQMLFEARRVEEIFNIFENVAIITFNYDRAIEHFVLHAVKNYFNLDWKIAEEVCRKLEVIHAYGQVGSLPWRTTEATGTGYGTRQSLGTLPMAIEQLRTFTEEYDDATRRERIHEVIRWADNIVFIGFSFMHLNLDLLKSADAGNSKALYGTTFGMSASNIKYTVNELTKVFPPHGFRAIELPGLPGHKLLEDFWSAILYA